MNLSAALHKDIISGFSERANIIIDEKGVIALFKTYPLSQLPDISEIIEAIRRM